MEATGPLPAPDPGALSGDLAAALAPLVERVGALLPRLQVSSGRTLLAVFDSGPGQLGSPRAGRESASPSTPAPAPAPRSRPATSSTCRTRPIAPTCCASLPRRPS